MATDAAATTAIRTVRLPFIVTPLLHRFSAASMCYASDHTPPLSRFGFGQPIAATGGAGLTMLPPNNCCI
ncbi:MAG: hypothetical protein KDB49_18415, partial [Mycobacterium sp.]|nr:hypothetical protein [Mycobacterium sp.]